ncbi:uncharacterized protein LOC126735291 [Anthonomus grandis grandis]|uniref:uncharacterized protein LOC126735291 n=1 Tax=Anthonomus grandis grandis TaxID=2921223 RepID=UPI0021667997|nr:uncharacterized protein LOC126735291 [Anthonomus grandis grandis]
MFENRVIYFEENFVPAAIEGHSDLALGNDFQEIQEPILQNNLTQLENVLYERSDGNNENSDIIPDLQVVQNPEEIQSHDSLQDVFQDEQDIGITQTENEEDSSSPDENIPLANLKELQRKENMKKKKNKISWKERSKLKNITKHPLREACKDSCSKKWKKLIKEEQRQSIHDSFWSLTWYDQRKCILNSCSRVSVKKRTITAGYYQ